MRAGGGNAESSKMLWFKDKSLERNKRKEEWGLMRGSSMQEDFLPALSEVVSLLPQEAPEATIIVLKLFVVSIPILSQVK